MTAGLDFSRGRAVIPIDVDLQDPPEVIGAMLEKWREGYEMVFAIRSRRDSDSHLKSFSARLFYRIYNWMSDVEMPRDAGDFRLLDRRVVDAICSLPERNRFMKGLFVWPGFRQAVVSYERQPRSRGDTKFGYWRLWNFAIDGMTSFSTLPLRVWSYVGGLVALISFLYAIFLIGRTLIYGIELPGYASLMVVVLFLGGLQLLTLGIIGEYLGRTYEEVKGRPIYVVRKTNGLMGWIAMPSHKGSAAAMERARALSIRPSRMAGFVRHSVLPDYWASSRMWRCRGWYAWPRPFRYLCGSN